MKQLGKILAVFVATASLAFAGFAIATVFAGPDWVQMTRAAYLDHYRFAQGPSPDYLWTATSLPDNRQVASSKRLPEVITKVLDEVSQRNQQTLQGLNDRVPVLEERVALLEKAKASDEKSLETYVEVQRTRLAAARQKELDLGKQILELTAKSAALEALTVERRGDVLRIQQQVAEVRADQTRIEAIIVQQENLLQQLEGDLNRAQMRNESLKKQLQD